MAQRKLFRMIIPAYPGNNIYTRVANRTTALGPVLVASAAAKQRGWEVEVIDENNCSHRSWPPKAGDGHIDHALLQRERPADIVGFYASLSSTIPRVFKLAKFYQSVGAVTVAGGYHVRSLPKEAIDNGIDIVALDGGEESMPKIMEVYAQPPDHKGLWYIGDSVRGEEKIVNCVRPEGISMWAGIKDIIYKFEGKIVTNPSPPSIGNCKLWPLPDFGLLKYARLKVYPVNWKRGCPFHCEFCAVHEKPNFVSAEELLAQVENAVEKYRARNFFIVDDHFGGDLTNPEERQETLKALGLLAKYQKRIGRRLSFTIQTRLNNSEDIELLKAMRAAGIDVVCIGYESVVAQELRDMRKGYGAKEMLRWTDLWHQAGFFVHGMFIFGYPHKLEEGPKDEQAARTELMANAEQLRQFIKAGKIDTVQILLTVPLPGTDLRDRLKKEGRLLDIGWEYYDGQWPVYEPKDGTTPEDLQVAAKLVMKDFYGFRNIPRVFVNWIFHFPLIVFPSVATLLTFRVAGIKRAYQYWRDRYHRNPWVRAGGWFVVRSWLKNFHKSDFPEQLKKARAKLAERDKSNK